MAEGQQLRLERMSQQSNLLGAEDDWTGVTSSVARRRLQNRINQRAFRKRKQVEAMQGTSSSSQSILKATQINSSSSSKESSISAAPENELVEHHSPANELWGLFNSALKRAQLDRRKLSQVAKLCKLGPLDQRKLISEFQRWMNYSQTPGSPRIDHALVLIKFNVLRAILSNGLDLGYAEGDYSNDALSCFTDPTKPNWDVRAVPKALQPTILQRQIPHHPWIDILPSPVMRDNLLLAGDAYNEMDLCADLVGFFSADKGRTGMIVWGPPWDVAGWEITASFVRHWGWTIQGCEQLLQSTNYWRERRGERPLQIERIICEMESETQSES